MQGNACTLVPTVFRWHKKMEFKFHFYFSFFFGLEKWNSISISIFHFLCTCDIEKRIWISFVVFRFRITLKNGFEFRFSCFVFASLWKTDLNFGFRILFIALLWKTDLPFVFHFSFSHPLWKTDLNFVFHFSFLYMWHLLLSLPKAWKLVISVFWREYQTVMAALEGVLDEDFVRCFLIQQKHTYEDLVVEINNRYPNLKSCSLRSVKRFCSHHGIRKRMPVCDEALDTAVRTAVSEVRGCKLISNP